MSLAVTDLIALSAIALLGLPHGGFDGAIALMMNWHKKKQGMAAFLLLYLAISAGVIMLWFMAPVLCLGLFLVISLIHFGLGDMQFISLPADYQKAFFRFVKVIGIFCHGGLVTIALPAFHPEQAGQIFQILSGEDAILLIPVLSGLLPVWCAALVFYLGLSTHLKSLRGFAIELVILGFVMWILPPLAGFALYFCGFHSLRHMISLFRALPKEMSYATSIKMGLFFSALSWAAGLAGFIFLHFIGGIQQSDAILQITFIGLAALTMPHMLLVDMIFRPRQHPPSSHNRGMI